MKSSLLLRATFIALTLAAAACSSTSGKDKPLPPDNPFKPGERAAREQKLAADELYRQARLSLDSADYATALSRYGTIATRFPFTEYATQADLEKIYALYRSYQPDDALIAADKFLKEHPRHPAVDYVQYLKGLVNSSRTEGLSGALGLDATKEDVGYLRRAFDDFSLLTQKYPNSPYTGDARQHMIDLRNRIARHDMHVVDFYMRRGAFLAAAKRSEQIIAQYPGAPATLDALKALEASYRQAGMKEQADEVAKLLAAQRQQPEGRSDYPVPPPAPGWFGFGSKTPAATENVTAQAAAPAPKEKKSWLRQLFTPGSEEAEGATIVIPSQSAQPDDAKSSSAPAAAGDAAAAKANPNELHGSGFKIYMEPYEENADTAAAKAKQAEPAAAPADDAKQPAPTTTPTSDATPAPATSTP